MSCLETNWSPSFSFCCSACCTPFNHLISASPVFMFRLIFDNQVIDTLTKTIRYYNPSMCGQVSTQVVKLLRYWYFFVYLIICTSFNYTIDSIKTSSGKDAILTCLICCFQFWKFPYILYYLFMHYTLTLKWNFANLFTLCFLQNLLQTKKSTCFGRPDKHWELASGVYFLPNPDR